MESVYIRTDDRTQMLPVTDLVQQEVNSSGVTAGVCHRYVPPTTAGLCINENADPMVTHDVLHVVDRMIPFTNPAYRHMEDNSAAHVKAIFFGSSETVLIAQGRLILGTWQGIFFCEFDGPRDRHFLVKIVAD